MVLLTDYKHSANSLFKRSQACCSLPNPTTTFLARFLTSLLGNLSEDILLPSSASFLQSTCTKLTSASFKNHGLYYIVPLLKPTESATESQMSLPNKPLHRPLFPCPRAPAQKGSRDGADKMFGARFGGGNRRIWVQTLVFSESKNPARGSEARRHSAALRRADPRRPRGTRTGGFAAAGRARAAGPARTARARSPSREGVGREGRAQGARSQRAWR